MRQRRRALGAVAVLGAAALVAACGSSGGSSSATTSGGSKTTTSGGSGGGTAKVAGLYGTLPPTGTPSNGGTITFGQVTGATPTYIMPITPSNNGSVYNSYQFQNLLYMPLYESPTGSSPVDSSTLSLAETPKYSNGNKTVTITIRPGFKWSSGATVTGEDVVFFIDLVKAAIKENAANFSNYTPGYFPDNVTSATASGETVTLNLNKAYNPGYFTNDQLGLLYAFPSQSWDVDAVGGAKVDYTTPAGAKKIYDFLNKQATDLSTFATSPIWSVVDGPAKLSSFTPSTSAYTMVPNPSYGGSVKMRYAEWKVETFTSYAAQLNALKAGSLDIANLDSTQVPDIPSLKSAYNVYGVPDFGFQGAFFNFKNTTGDFDKIIGQLYVRQALAYLMNDAGYIKGIFKGAAGQAYGPVPSAPASPYAPSNALTDPYPYSVSKAKSLLQSHGWSIVPNGVDTCQKPGTGAGECGAGIPKGAKLQMNWFYTNQPTFEGLESESLASTASEVGIKISVTAKTFNFLIQNYDNPSAKSNINKWDVNYFGGFTDDNYPTTNAIFNTTGTYNIGSYSSSEADKLITASVFGNNTSAVKNEASYLTTNLPALFTPNPDQIYAVSKKVGGAADGFTALTQYTVYPGYFYLNK